MDSVCARLEAQFGNLPFRPVPAHRLDRDTSGILLCGASYEALAGLQGALRNHQTHKEYLAWVEGRFETSQLLVGRIAKAWTKGTRKMQLSAQGQTLPCAWRARWTSNNDASLVQLRLLTGRTHQIRAQMAAIGHPVLGDVKYGAQKRSGGMLLHAFRVILPGRRDIHLSHPPGLAVSCRPAFPLFWKLPRKLTGRLNRSRLNPQTDIKAIYERQQGSLAHCGALRAPECGQIDAFQPPYQSNRAITHDMPGVTRDRMEGHCAPQGPKTFEIVDTGGITLDAAANVADGPQGIRGFEAEILAQADEALFPGGGRGFCC